MVKFEPIGIGLIAHFLVVCKGSIFTGGVLGGDTCDGVGIGDEAVNGAGDGENDPYEHRGNARNHAHNNQAKQAQGVGRVLVGTVHAGFKGLKFHVADAVQLVDGAGRVFPEFVLIDAEAAAFGSGGHLLKGVVGRFPGGRGEQRAQNGAGFLRQRQRIFPADGFFGSRMYEHFDGVLAMYHDQGLAPFKALAMDDGVNYTAGLPIVRTSPAHGTAYDIAGQNLASEESFRQAIYAAIDIYRNRLRFKEATAHPLRKQYFDKSADNEKLDLTKDEDDTI